MIGILCYFFLFPSLPDYSRNLLGVRFAGKQTSSGRDRHEEEDGVCTCFKIVKS